MLKSTYTTSAFHLAEKLMQNPNTQLVDRTKSAKENAEYVAEFIVHLAEQFSQKQFTLHDDYLKGNRKQS
ncbi:hypothetical protein [Glaesserella parasuis]|uniref:hypothetical protein n=1 Tax=Glaesserella parasuis TaxID=738 RepID=UPI000AAF264B|nr:hypothetical protein [Glaesserella parasuis]MDG6263170.1 hypothetical protein [Glaesserella parasuis]MDG6283962.1 hypothetical protein [Glaesserella parasuis]MDG6290596.1 hypothetical protein [Glaesserella parasuis]MDG6292612.1 hypothetical protein [Glaesserella parasuis]MDG6306442.1 hypothetical protein [Glaesserella parasuis]